MDTTLRYESNSGASIEFAPDSAYHYKGATLHDYSHGYESSGGRITQWTQDITDWTLDAVVAGSTAEDRNAMIEAFEYDVLKMTPGKLWSGDYYLECYVTASSKDLWWSDEGLMHASLTVTAEKPRWVREFFKVFGDGRRDDDDTGIDYAHDWSFDYANNLSISFAKNTGIVEAPFRMRVYGPTPDTVQIIIGHNVYAVDVVLKKGELLTIDSREKTIALTKADGTAENLFAKRVGTQRVGSGSYVFEAIKPGSNTVSWSQKYVFDLTVYDERAEPRW